MKSTMKTFKTTITRAAKDLQHPTLLLWQIGSSGDHASASALPWSKTAHLCMESLVSYLSARGGQSSFLTPQLENISVFVEDVTEANRKITWYF